jgi:hypothetical protein
MTNDRMPEPPAHLDAIAARLDALEAQNRRLRQLLIVVLAVAAAVGARAQVAPAAVSGDRFVLVDAQSRTHALLEMAAPAPPAGGRYPLLTFFDNAGKPRLRLGLAARGPMLEVIDESGRAKDYLAPAGIRPLTQP